MSEKPVRLGLLSPLSGLVEIYGLEICWAAQIACQEVNENGGVLRRPLELIIEDDGSLPESAVIAAKALVKKHRCVSIIGNLLSNSRISVAYQVAEPFEIPYLNFSFYEGSILSRYFFHFAALPNQQIDQMIPYMTDKYGPRMFFAGNNYEWPRGSIDAAKRTLLSINGEIVGEEYLPIGVSSEEIDRLLDKVSQAAPDIFSPCFAGADQVHLLTLFSEKGLKNRMAVVMGHYDEMMASQLSPEVRDGFYSSNTYFMTIDTPENQYYMDRLAALPEVNGIWPQGNGILTNFGEGTYLCVKAFAKAANKAGRLDPEALVEALETISLIGPQGEVHMDPTTHHAKVNTYLARCRANGSFQIVKKFGSIAPIIPERYRHQQIKHQATLEEEIRLQARMLEQMFDGVLLFNTQNKTIIYANVAGERMFGYSKNELLYKHISLLIAPTDQSLKETTLQLTQILEQKGTWQGEVQHIKKDGTLFWCSLSFSIFTHPLYGEVWMAIARDITERKKAEEMLKESESKYRFLLDNLDLGVTLVNRDRNIIMTNAAMGKMFDKPIEAFVGRKCYLEFEKRGHICAHCPGIKAMESGLPQSVERKGVKDDGSVLTAMVRALPIFGKESQVIGFMEVVQDITEQKKTQEEKTNLENRLIQAQKMEAIGTLAGGIAHDFNNILAVILGYGEMAREDAPSGTKLEKDLEKVVTAAHRAKDLVKQILAFSRQAKVERFPIQIQPLIKEGLKMLRSSIPTTISITEKIDPKSGIILADPTQVHQILMNLCTNAYHAMEGAGGALSVTVKTTFIESDDKVMLLHVTSGEYVEFTVTDTGVGIGPDVVEKIFDPYFTTKEIGKGTGMGLAIIHRIMKDYGGTITVETQLGQGTTFHVYFPVIEKDAVPEVKKLEDIPLGEERILFIDDEELLSEMGKDMLEKLGYHVTVRRSSFEALETFQNNPKDFDMVITDQTMPGITGSDLARRMIQIRPDIPIILCTGYSNLIDEHSAKALGIKEFALKPLTKGAIGALIRKVLDAAVPVTG